MLSRRFRVSPRGDRLDPCVTRQPGAPRAECSLGGFQAEGLAPDARIGQIALPLEPGHPEGGRGL